MSEPRAVDETPRPKPLFPYDKFTVVFSVGRPPGAAIYDTRGATIYDTGLQVYRGKPFGIARHHATEKIAFILGPLGRGLLPVELAPFYRGIYDRKLKAAQCLVIKEMREALGDEDADEE